MLESLKQHAAEALARLMTNRFDGTTDGQLYEQQAVIWGDIKYLAMDMQQGRAHWEDDASKFYELLTELGKIGVELERRERRRAA